MDQRFRKPMQICVSISRNSNTVDPTDFYPLIVGRYVWEIRKIPQMRQNTMWIQAVMLSRCPILQSFSTQPGALTCQRLRTREFTLIPSNSPKICFCKSSSVQPHVKRAAVCVWPLWTGSTPYGLFIKRTFIEVGRCCKAAIKNEMWIHFNYQSAYYHKTGEVARLK